MQQIKWVIPTEAVRAMATPEAAGLIVSLVLRRQARFLPHAELILNENGFSADLQYEDPALPGQTQHIAVQMAAVPQENAYLARPMEGVRT